MLRILLKEGRAIEATEDMRRFADEVVEELQQFIEEPLLIFSEDNNFYWRVVSGPGGRTKNIGVRFSLFQKMGGVESAMMGTNETSHGSLIRIFYTLDRNGDPVFTPPRPAQVLHELIHAFDPKLEKKIVYKGMVDRGEQTTAEYYQDEAEQDAYMRQDAIELATALNKFPLEKSKELLRSKVLVPKNPVGARQERMMAWAQDPKMWRKFINTVYDEVVSRRIPKQQPTEFQKRLRATKT